MDGLLEGTTSDDGVASSILNSPTLGDIEEHFCAR